MSGPLRVAFAGDRAVAVEVLDHLLAAGVRPVALLVPSVGRASHASALIERCGHLDRSAVLTGAAFRQPQGVEVLRALDLDFLVSVHFPYLVPQVVLGIPRRGCLNLHPAYLPFNRGWHTASWAILEGTPIGATLHYMDAGIDTGPIVHQEELEVGPADTAASLYPRLFALEVEVFRRGWAAVLEGAVPAHQRREAGTAHDKDQLHQPEVQRIALDEPVPPRDLLRRLRALTTSRVEEAAYFEQAGRRFRLQLTVVEEHHPEPDSATRPAE
jgi:methionyl-tRNA formyltransferase